MELQQKHSVPENVYENQAAMKTEDVSQPPQTPPRAFPSNVSGKKIIVPLLILNLLLLTSILLVMGIHYDRFRRSRDDQEMWYLHNGTFYLFWSNQSDCDAAYSFCKERKADLATVTANNRDWLQSKINKKRLLVKRDNADKLFMPGCTIFDKSSNLTEPAEGGVCAAVSSMHDDGIYSSGDREN